MGKSRSPNYPSISLTDAVEKARVLYEKENRRKMAREAIAEHLGYTGLNGASVSLISALSKYGLLEGRGDEIRVSDDAITILVDTPDSSDRQEALYRAATSPALFAELIRHFEGAVPSESTLRIYLQKNGFTPKAAQAAGQAFRETMGILDLEGPGRERRFSDEFAVETESVSASIPSSRAEQEPRAVSVPIIPREPAELPPVVFPLPRGNSIEIRLRKKLTPDEFDQVHSLLELLRASIVDEEAGQETVSAIRMP